jgi:hypothetical protein
MFCFLGYIRLEIDEYELEKFVAKRYENALDEIPLKVRTERYPGEIDITIYVNQVTDEKWGFARQLMDELSAQGLHNIVVIQKSEN